MRRTRWHGGQRLAACATYDGRWDSRTSFMNPSWSYTDLPAASQTWPLYRPRLCTAPVAEQLLDVMTFASCRRWRLGQSNFRDQPPRATHATNTDSPPPRACSSQTTHNRHRFRRQPQKLQRARGTGCGRAEVKTQSAVEHVKVEHTCRRYRRHKQHQDCQGARPR